MRLQRVRQDWVIKHSTDTGINNIIYVMPFFLSPN